MVLQDLDQCFTIYLSLTSSLGLANVQPHPDVSVLPIRAQGTSRYPLSHSVGADTELLRRFSYVQPTSSHPSRLRPVECPCSVQCMVAGLTRARIGSLDVVSERGEAPTLAMAAEAVREDSRGSQQGQVSARIQKYILRPQDTRL